VAFATTLTDLRLPSLGSTAAGRALARWRQQLWRCIPRGGRVWLASRSPDLVFVPDGDRAHAFRDVIGERQLLGVVDADSEAALPGGVLAGKRSWRSTILELPSDAVLIRGVVLPAQVGANLRRVITYELDRLTPFDAAAVYYDAHVVNEVAQGAKVQVELAICPRASASRWLERLSRAGAPVSRVTWPEAWSDANLLPPESRPRPQRLRMLMPWVLAVVIAALLFAVAMTPLWQKSNDQIRLTQTLRQVSAEAAEVSRLREALDRARLGSVAVLERKRDRPRMTDLLLELTDLLPDGTWVQTLNFRDGEVDIRGESTQATALIGVLERGAGISNVTFRSPVMQIAATGSERFHIAFDYRPAESQ
jgi:general secretion pathway protein L